MKIFKKVRYSNGRRHIYFMGLKIFSYNITKISPPPYDIFNYKQLLLQNTKFPHLVGIVISRAAVIGKNCTIYQNVTIGAKDIEHGDGLTSANYPRIGNNVIIYAGAVIVGGVTIGDNAIIGANSVVLSDVPANHIAYGVPAKAKPVNI